MDRLCWALVLLLNAVTLAVYGFDKWRARRPGARRVPERTLLWLVLLGGWVGAWLGMAWFRHKTQKASFRRWAVLWTLLSPFWLLVWWSLRGG
ncbi:MAG: DUF1294 domain-containing protein [Planctomycetes bacterium]|nr:DUF1294 domain-containing protein [Planctomycetota bacterium]